MTTDRPQSAPRHAEQRIQQLADEGHRASLSIQRLDIYDGWLIRVRIDDATSQTAVGDREITAARVNVLELYANELIDQCLNATKDTEQEPHA